MSPRALRRAGGLAVLAIALALAFGFPGPLRAAVDGYFFGQTSNSSVFQSGWVAAPTGLSASASGYDTSLSWTAGHGVATTALNGADGGGGASASCGSYTQLNASVTSPTTDSGRANGSLNGHWYCYQVVGSHGSWSASGAFTPLVIGLKTTAVALGTGTGSLSTNDTITLTFNQQTNVPGTNVQVRTCPTNSPKIVMIGTSTACGTPGTYSIGVLTLSSGTFSGSAQTHASSTVAVSGSAPWTVTITVKSAGSNTTTGAVWTFTPASGIQSNTGAAAVCISTCTQPAPSGSF